MKLIENSIDAAISLAPDSPIDLEKTMASCDSLKLSSPDMMALVKNSEVENVPKTGNNITEMTNGNHENAAKNYNGTLNGHLDTCPDEDFQLLLENSDDEESCSKKVDDDGISAPQIVQEIEDLLGIDASAIGIDDELDKDLDNLDSADSIDLSDRENLVNGEIVGSESQESQVDDVNEVVHTKNKIDLIRTSDNNEEAECNSSTNVPCISSIEREKNPESKETLHESNLKEVFVQKSREHCNANKEDCKLDSKKENDSLGQENEEVPSVRKLHQSNGEAEKTILVAEDENDSHSVAETEENMFGWTVLDSVDTSEDEVKNSQTSVLSQDTLENGDQKDNITKTEEDKPVVITSKPAGDTKEELHRKRAVSLDEEDIDCKKPKLEKIESNLSVLQQLKRPNSDGFVDDIEVKRTKIVDLESAETGTGKHRDESLNTVVDVEDGSKNKNIMEKDIDANNTKSNVGHAVVTIDLKSGNRNKSSVVDICSENVGEENDQESHDNGSNVVDQEPSSPDLEKDIIDYGNSNSVSTELSKSSNALVQIAFSSDPEEIPNNDSARDSIKEPLTSSQTSLKLSQSSSTLMEKDTFCSGLTDESNKGSIKGSVEEPLGNSQTLSREPCEESVEDINEESLGNSQSPTQDCKSMKDSAEESLGNSQLLSEDLCGSMAVTQQTLDSNDATEAESTSSKPFEGEGKTLNLKDKKDNVPENVVMPVETTASSNSIEKIYDSTKDSTETSLDNSSTSIEVLESISKSESKICNVSETDKEEKLTNTDDSATDSKVRDCSIIASTSESEKNKNKTDSSLHISAETSKNETLLVENGGNKNKIKQFENEKVNSEEVIPVDVKEILKSNVLKTSQPIEEVIIENNQNKTFSSLTQKHIDSKTNLDKSIERVVEKARKEVGKVLPVLKKFHKSKLKKLTRTELEETVVMKICEAITDRSELGQLRLRCQALENTTDMWRKKAIQFEKQNRELEMVLKRFMSETEQMKKDNQNKVILPIKVTRSVGLQVVLASSVQGSLVASKKLEQENKQRQQRQQHVIEKQKHQQHVDRQRRAEAREPVKPAATFTPPVQRPVVKPGPGRPPKSQPSPTPSQVPASTKPSPASTTLKTIAPKPPTPSPSKTMEVIDLTEKEEKAKSLPQNSVGKGIRVNQPTQLCIVQSNATTTPTQTMAYLVQKTGPRPQQYLVATTTPSPPKPNTVVTRSPTAVPLRFAGGQLIPLQTSPGPQVAVRTGTPVGQTATRQVPPAIRLQTQVAVLKHPAPLPAAPPFASRPGQKNPPTKPQLKIAKTINGIMLSWSMTLTRDMAEMASYQLYAYQESSQPPTTSLWKKVGDVKALPLPMACTLTQFVDGHKYHFAVRAVDVHNRIGPFSQPSTILLTR